MACAWLAALGAGEVPSGRPGRSPSSSSPAAGRRWPRSGRTGLASPLTTSAGRLFDAVAALCGIRAEVNYEGQAAIELEAAAAACAGTPTGAYPMPLIDESPGPLLLDARETIAAVREDLGSVRRTRRGALPRRLRGGHGEALRPDRGGPRARLGRALGRRLPEPAAARAVASGLRERGLRVLIPRQLPPNDGGISYGQAAIAAVANAAGGDA